MAEPIFAYVPIDALRELVTYADQQRDLVDLAHGASQAARDDSDAQLRALVAALGVPGLLPDEDGTG